MPRCWLSFSRAIVGVSRYTACMFAFTILEHVLVWMFLIGLVGSSIVVIASFVEDIIELFGD